MTISTALIIGQQRPLGTGPEFHAIEAATAAPMEPAFHGASAADAEAACRLASDAFSPYRALPPEKRAAFLEAAAEAILALGDELIVRCMAETGLPRARLEGERGRTVGQLRMFAGIIRSGLGFERRYDPVLPDREPLPRPDLRLRSVPLGPVVVFSASNFPLAFSVAGGDTASALAAGCPVVVKAHPAHPGTSALVGGAIAAAAEATGIPEGTFSMLFDPGHEIGLALVADPRVKAVGFTGSRQGGLALMEVAGNRPEPIPVYAEMSAINPVFLMPAALEEKAETIAAAFVASLTAGAGQFCTNPGLVVAVKGAELDRFITAAAEAVSASAPATMLTPGICRSYGKRVEQTGANAAVALAAEGQQGDAQQCVARLFTTTAQALLGDEALQQETFGAASLIVVCDSLAEMEAVVHAMEGQLTASIHALASDHAAVGRLLPALELKVGRILFNGFGTGVEVSHAMVHGGPFPATSDGRTTSVGSLAVTRFLRPVCYQDCPSDLLPDDIRELTPTGD